jgi:hypothetical protein
VEDGVPVVINYGITLRFAFCLVTTGVALILVGVRIVAICLRVLQVEVPGYFFWRPLLAAATTALVVLPVTLGLPIKAGLIGWLGAEVGGILYVVVLVVLGVAVFLVFAILFDAINLEDGRFWRSIVGGFGPLRYFFVPIFAVCKFLLRHQFRACVRPPIAWVTSTTAEGLRDSMLFKVDVVPVTEVSQRTKAGVVIPQGTRLEFTLRVHSILSPVYDSIAFLRIDGEAVPSSLQVLGTCEPGQEYNVALTYVVGDRLDPGVHELLVDLETYNAPNPTMPPEAGLRKGWWTVTDLRLRWFHEEQYFIEVVNPE